MTRRRMTVSGYRRARNGPSSCPSSSIAARPDRAARASQQAPRPRITTTTVRSRIATSLMNPRPRAQHVRGAGAVMAVELLLRDRAWADDAHVALQHVEELRHLVEAGLSQDGADARDDARVVPQLGFSGVFPCRRRVARQQRAQPRVTVRMHRPELDAAELTAFAPDPAVDIKGWSWTVHLY